MIEAITPPAELQWPLPWRERTLGGISKVADVWINGHRHQIVKDRHGDGRVYYTIFWDREPSGSATYNWRLLGRCEDLLTLRCVLQNRLTHGVTDGRKT